MSEATFDRDGYPTDDYLQALRDWPFERGYVGLLELAAEGWSYPDYATGPTEAEEQGVAFTFVTGGWSGNEDIVGALQDNFLFWSQCWEASYRGGKFEFVVPKRLQGKPEAASA